MLSLQEVERITSLAEKLYPFAYALFPDELLAHQLVMDGLSRMLLDDENQDSFLQQDPLDWKVVSSYIFDLAKKRSKHSPFPKDSKGPFFKLNLSQRAALILRYRYHLKSKEGGQILDVSLADFLSFLYRGKALLLKEV